MKTRPILMHKRSIENLLAGRKTQTRRIVKVRDLLQVRRGDAEHYRGVSADGCVEHCLNDVGMTGLLALCPFGQPGDLLWVRESWRTYEALDKTAPRSLIAGTGLVYEAGGRNFRHEHDLDGMGNKVRPGMFMPRWASRLTLRLTDVRLERVQATSREDIVAEGVAVPVHDGHAVIELTGKSPPAKFLTKDQLGDVGALLRAHWASLWENTNGVGAWERNAWCWALTFEVLRANVDAVLARMAA